MSICLFCEKKYIKLKKNQKYCSIKCRRKKEWKNIKEKKNTKIHIKKCKYCSQLFKTKSILSIYCSKTCKSKSHPSNKYYKKKLYLPKQCCYCNKEFIQKKQNHIFCSNKCSNSSWKKRNHKHRIKKMIKRRKERCKEDKAYHIKINLRRRINKALKGEYKSKSTEFILGCDFETLRKHIESKFTLGMNWKNYGYGWHIDHIKPLSLAKSKEEIYKLSHYTNLQPLWAKENIKKSNKYIY